MMSDIWCLNGELPEARARELEATLEMVADERGEFPPTLSYFEQPGEAEWRVEIFFATQPDSEFLTAVLSRMGLGDWPHELAPVEDKDWVSESQKLLAPVEAGRFFVYGSHDADKAKADAINLQIDAGQAFGTGKHETTAACLEVLDQLADDIRPKTMLDLGTGSGVLALAGQKVWPKMRIIASDIDPIAIEVTAENITVNDGISRQVGSGLPGMAVVVAPGLDDPAFKDEKPFDLITANILAGPLVDLAPDIVDALAKSGTLVLSGLLVTQEKEVLEPYLARGLVSLGRVEKGEWLALVLRKP
jgi:ribosomal protein L11 methyltransferase